MYENNRFDRQNLTRVTKTFLTNFSFTDWALVELRIIAGYIVRRESRAGTTVNPHIVIRKTVANRMRSLFTLNHLGWYRMKANLVHRAIKSNRAICVSGHR
jgi:hypothetical protein